MFLVVQNCSGVFICTVNLILLLIISIAASLYSLIIARFHVGRIVKTSASLHTTLSTVKLRFHIGAGDNSAVRCRHPSASNGRKFSINRLLHKRNGAELFAVLHYSWRTLSTRMVNDWPRQRRLTTQKKTSKRTFHVAFLHRIVVDELVDFEGIFAARLSQVLDLFHVRQRVEGTAEVRFPALRLVDVVAIFACGH